MGGTTAGFQHGAHWLQRGHAEIGYFYVIFLV